MNTNFSESYCAYALNSGLLHKKFHDTEHGVMPSTDNELFERLVLEINQAGLSWNIILKKRKGLQDVYCKFDINKIAGFSQMKMKEILQDRRIIRNSLKVSSIVYNAKKIIEIQQQFGSFRNWLDQHYPKPLEEWVKLFKQQFKFVGPEIVNEFLMGIGYIQGAHHPNCELYKNV